MTGIGAASPLLQPAAALSDALADDHGGKQTVLATAFSTHVPQIALTSATATYGLVGLVPGSLAAHVLMSLGTLVARRGHVRAAWSTGPIERPDAPPLRAERSGMSYANARTD
jgi:hypothetical protein